MHATPELNDALTPAALAHAESLIQSFPDYPKPGVLFRDITSLVTDPAALKTTAAALIEPFEGQFDVIAGAEARGFLLAAAAAMLAGTGVLPVRKAGKLPKPAGSVSYDLEYGSATIEANHDLPAGTRVLLVDDALATGGTLAAARKLLEGFDYRVIGTAVMFEVDGLGGREALGDLPLHIAFPG